MSKRRMIVKKQYEVLRLHHERGWPMRQIALVLQISVGSVQRVIKCASRIGVGWPLEAADKQRLHQELYPEAASQSRGVELDFEHLHKEMQKKAVTLKLLWQEHCEEGYPYGYAHFCRGYRKWKKQHKLTLRRSHAPGDEVYVDFAGMTVVVGDRKAQIYVAALGASNYTFATAVWDQGLRNWLQCNTEMLEFFGGVPQLIVPDNLKSGVTKACRYDPDVNPMYEQWSAHYDVHIVPTRPRKPTDKGKVENAVLQVERNVLAPLRDCRFQTLTELNKAIRPLLEGLNDKPFSNMSGTRRSLFETLDKPALRALPLLRFRYVESENVKVGMDYHCCFESHYYSVPYAYAGRKVQVQGDSQVVTFYCDGEQIAMHRRRFDKRISEMSTEFSHMPEQHQAVEMWSAERLKGWAISIGEHCHIWVCARLSEVTHTQQISRRLIGVLSLGDKYGNARLNEACKIANEQRLDRRAQIVDILKNNIDRKPRAKQLDLQLPQDHRNVRGANHFK